MNQIPYHYGKKHLKQMEDMKRSCFAKYVDTSKCSELEEAMNKLKDRVLECYERPIHRKLEKESKAFRDMMIHDGCFIVLLIRDGYPLDLQKLGRQRYDILYDLLLLENQIPFFLLDKLDEIITEKSTRAQTDFSKRALTFFQGSGIQIWLGRRRTCHSSTLHLLDLVHQCCLPSPQGIQQHKEYLEKIKGKGKNAVDKCCPSSMSHLLDLVQCKCGRPSPQDIEQHDSIAEGPSPQGKQQRQKYLEKIKGKGKNVVDKCSLLSISHILDLVQCKCGHPSPQGIEEYGDYSIAEGSQRSWKFIRSATELDDAGIHFLGKNVFQDQDRGLFDIKFTKRPFRIKILKIKIPMLLMCKKLLEIPMLTVDDTTESVLRNLLAYEQFNSGPTYVLDYVTFMYNLINTGKDVQLLDTSYVIDNWLGDDETVAKMFNKLGDRLYDSGNFYYAEIFDKVNKHCNGEWNKAKAKLRKDYFGSPWSYCSFFAALVLLVITLLQTIYTLIPYYLPK